MIPYLPTSLCSVLPKAMEPAEAQNEGCFSAPPWLGLLWDFSLGLSVGGEEWQVLKAFEALEDGVAVGDVVTGLVNCVARSVLLDLLTPALDPPLFLTSFDRETNSKNGFGGYIICPI